MVEQDPISDELILDLLSSLKHRAEKSDDLSSFIPSFVQVIDLKTLENSNTQVMYGRNGTGKTHIFKGFEELATHNQEKYNIIPIYFDMRNLNISRISPDLKEEDVVELFFKDFLYALVEKIEKFNDLYVLNSSNSKFQSSHIANNRAQLKFKTGIRKLRKSFDNRHMREKIDSYTKNIRERRIASTKGQMGAELSSTPSLSAGATAEIGREHEEFVEVTIQASHFTDYTALLEGFVEIADAFGAKQIVILVDEWSQVDIALQPLVSELIRRTLGTSNRISLKFAALKFLSKFSEKIADRRIGLQPGIDITELTDLNQIFTFDLDRKAVRHFLLFILIKHLLEIIAREVFEYDFDDHSQKIFVVVQRVFDRIFEHIFESADAFDHFIRASEGNPRDFLSMISECCATHGAAQLPIAMKAVRASAINYFKTAKMENFSSGNVSGAALFDKMFSRCVQNKSKIFSVSKSIDRTSNELKDLWAQRIVHLIDNNYEYLNSESDKVESFAIYAIDYGKILGLRSDKNGAEKLDGIVQEATHVISGLYDGSTHQAILEHIDKEDSSLAKVSEIIGASPDNANFTDPSHMLDATVLFEKIKRINIDDIILGHRINFSNDNIES